MTSLSLQIDNRPVIIALLEMSDLQLDGFVSPESARQQESQEGAITLPLDVVAGWRLPQRVRLFGREPIPEADAQLLHASNAPDASGEVRAQQTAVGSLIGKPPDCAEPKVDGARREFPALKMDSVSEHDRLAVGKPGFGAVPLDELVYRVPIAPLAVYRTRLFSTADLA